MYELSRAVRKFTDEPPASRDFKHRNQIRDSSDSAHRNVAEGFGRYNPPPKRRGRCSRPLSQQNTCPMKSLVRNAERWRHKKHRTPPRKNGSNDPNDPNA